MCLERIEKLIIVDELTGELLWGDGDLLEEDQKYRLEAYKEWLIDTCSGHDASCVDAALKRSYQLFDLLMEHADDSVNRFRFISGRGRWFIVMRKDGKVIHLEIVPRALGAYGVAQDLAMQISRDTDPYRAAESTSHMLDIPTFFIPPSAIMSNSEEKYLLYSDMLAYAEILAGTERCTK